MQEILLESMNLVANHDLLRTMAKSTNGQCVGIREMDKVSKSILHNENIKPVVTYHKKYTPFLDSWIYLMVIILLFGIEWFMRKWGGGY